MYGYLLYIDNIGKKLGDIFELSSSLLAFFRQISNILFTILEVVI